MGEGQQATEKNMRKSPETLNNPFSRLIGDLSTNYNVGWKKTRNLYHLHKCRRSLIRRESEVSSMILSTGFEVIV